MYDYNLIYFNSIDSTNKHVKAHMKELCQGDVIVSDIQTDGRGRLARKWCSDNDDNLYVTIVLKGFSEENFNNLKNITQYLSVVICEVLDEYSINTEIKWPNDIKVNDRKICGILSELSMEGALVKGMALGFGLNVGMTIDQTAQIDQPATSLLIECNKKIDKNVILKKILEKFFSGYERFLIQGFDLISEKYHKKNVCLNRTVTISLPTNDICGTVIGFDTDGTLILQTPLGAVTKITTGDLLC